PTTSTIATTSTTSTSTTTSTSSTTTTLPGCPAQAVPIAVGETKSGALATTDCRSAHRGSTYYADLFSFSGTAGQQVAIVLTSSAFAPVMYLVRSADGAVVTSGFGGGTFARIPSGDGFYTLPSTDTYFIEVTSLAANAVGAYQVTLGDVDTP